MFENDVNRIKACLEYNDYYSALEYAVLIKDKYIGEERNYFDRIIKNIKTGNYENLNNKKP